MVDDKAARLHPIVDTHSRSTTQVCAEPSDSVGCNGAAKQAADEGDVIHHVEGFEHLHGPRHGASWRTVSVETIGYFVG